MTPSGPILVGVDGSAHSRTAATWAVTEAGLRRAQLHLVIVNDRPTHDDELWSVVQKLGHELKTEHPQVAIYERIARGHPADRLIQRSAKAQLVVVGARGRGTFAAALLGSVSTKLAMHALGPVVVVREQRTSGPIIAGFDGSPESHAALQFACETAAEHATHVIAIQVTPDSTQTQDSPAPDVPLGDWDKLFPQVPMHREVRNGHPVAELTAAARNAQLLCVGHRGRGGFGGLLLGSVASGVLHHASCPVAVVRTGTSTGEHG